MHSIKRLALVFLLLTPLTVLAAVESAVPEPTSVNQVFQWMSKGSYITAISHEEHKAACYLWIPETCKRVRGLLILGANVPEHRLVGHEVIRRMCATNDLAILWCTPSILYPVDWSKPFPSEAALKPEREAMIAFLQKQLDALAATSGYDEIATAPWLPIGESTHMFLVDALLESRPQRSIAGIYLKNAHMPPANRETPVLCIYGTAQEWSQDKSDIRYQWNHIGWSYDHFLSERGSNPTWPRSLVIDGHSGHFDCSDQLVAYMARYIEQAVTARCPQDGNPFLKPVNFKAGFVADLPVPGHEGAATAPATAQDPRPWYFDRAVAQDAQQIAAINWKAESQLPVVLDAQGKAVSFDFNGVMKLKSVAFEPDSLTFSLHCDLAAVIPNGFANAGEKLARAPGTPTAEWLMGPLEPLGSNQFRIALDRSWLAGETGWLAIRHRGTVSIRDVVQPVNIDVQALRNTSGTPQTITFPPLADVKAGTDAVPLKAISDSGLPVSFFVVAGPAIVKDDKLLFTKLPPRTRLPIDITVAAWQWGRATEPRVTTAGIVMQTFHISPGKPAD